MGERNPNWLSSRAGPYYRLLGLAAAGLAFFLIVSLAAGLESPWRSSFLAILFYLFPTGVGLLVLPGNDAMSRMGFHRLEHALVGYFVGLTIIALVFVAREHATSSSNTLAYIKPAFFDYSLLGLAACGWIRAARSWRGFSAIENSLGPLLWCLPLFVVPYALAFFVFSRYPMTDLFQFTHIMKGAEEFARFDRLNPFTADSYAPVIQATLGSLLRLTGGNSLDAVWLVPFPAFLFRYAVIYALANRIVRQPFGIVVFVAMLLPFFGVGVPTNGELAALGGFLVMSMITSSADQKLLRSPRLIWGIVGATCIAAVLATFLARGIPAWSLLAVLIGFTLAANPMSRRFYLASALAMMCLAVLVTAPLHRLTILIFPAAAILLAWGLYPPISHRAMMPLVIALPLACAAIVSAILLRHYSGVEFLPEVGLVLTRWLEAPLNVNFSQSKDALPGMGSKVALFEMARTLGPLLILCSLAAVATALRWQMRTQSTGTAFFRTDAAWVAAYGMLLVLLLGLPFTYRLAFVPAALLAALIAQQLSFAGEHALRRWIVGFLGFGIIIAALEYGLPESKASAEEYVNRAMIVLLVCLGVALLAGMVGLRHRPWARPAVLLLVVWVVLFEKQLIRYHFLHYSIPGDPAPRTEPLSHYNRSDVELSEWFRENYDDGLLISDPYTLAIVRALTGLNSIVTFSNLDTMDQRAANALSQHLRTIISAAEDPLLKPLCSDWQSAAKLLGYGVSAESNFALARLGNRKWSGKDVLAFFGYREGFLASSAASVANVTIAEGRHEWILSATADHGGLKKKEAVVITVINDRTVAWALGIPTGYRHDPANSSVFHLRARERLVKHCEATLLSDGTLILSSPLGRS